MLGKRTFIGISVAVILLNVVLFVRRPLGERVTSEEPPSAASAIMLSRIREADQAASTPQGKRRREARLARRSTWQDEVSDSCRALWKATHGLNTAEVSAPGDSVLAPRVLVNPTRFRAIALNLTSERCDFKVEHPLRRSNEAFYKDCDGVSANDDVKINACFRRLLSYRNAMLDLATEGTPLSQITSPEVLAAKFEALATDPDRVTWGGLSAIVERMTELRPNDGELAKKALQLRYFDLVETDGDASSVREQLEKNMALAERSDPASRPLLEARMNLARLDGDTGTLTRIAGEIRETHPESPVGPYYLAWAAFLNGDRDAGMKWLTEAASIDDPRDERAKFTLKELAADRTAPTERLFVGIR